MRTSSPTDIESAARLLEKDDIDAIDDHDLTDPSDAESNSSWQSSSTIADRHKSRMRWLSRPGVRWLKRRRADPSCLVLAAAATIVLVMLLYNPYLSPEQRPIQALTNAMTFGWSEKIEYCTTWPVNDNGHVLADLKPPHDPLKLDSFAPPGGWKKPDGVRIIGMIFYGRKRTVDILDCYLQQNLAANGGYIDEWWFMSHTTIEEDVAWLEDLVRTNPDAYKIVGQGVCEGKSYGCLWEYAVEDKTIYIKVDDDIVYIHPDAIPQLVHTRINVPHPFGISANLVNSPGSAVQHYHYGAIHSFLPEESKSASYKADVTWRPSAKPHYPSSLIEASAVDAVKIPVPYRGHTWLMTSPAGGSVDLLKTPMGKYDQDGSHDRVEFGPAWKSWGIGAQQQYSLLHNLEQNWMDRYHFGRGISYPADAPAANASAIIAPIEGGPGGERTYDTEFHRYNLNFLAVWGSDIREQLPIADDDEQDLTVTVPQRTGRPVLIDTRSVVSHFSFSTQFAGMVTTDLLDRYRALANEVACPATNLKIPMDPRCKGF